jgi:hypothetical protein
MKAICSSETVSELHGVTTHKTVLFIINTTNNSNPKEKNMFGVTGMDIRAVLSDVRYIIIQATT